MEIRFSEQQEAIREGVGKVCAEFGDEYWSACDTDRPAVSLCAARSSQTVCSESAPPLPWRSKMRSSHHSIA